MVCACILPHLQVLSLHVLAPGWGGDTIGSDALQPETSDMLASTSIDIDTDGLDAAAPYSGTSYEDEDTESPQVADVASDQDPAAETSAPDGDQELTSSDDAQPQMAEDASDPVSSGPSMGERDDPQAEAVSRADIATEGSSRSNGTTIKRTPSSITFSF